MAFSQLCLPLRASHQLFPAFGAAVLMLFTDERLSSRHSFFIIVCCDFYLQLLPSTADYMKKKSRNDTTFGTGRQSNNDEAPEREAKEGREIIKGNGCVVLSTESIFGLRLKVNKLRRRVDEYPLIIYDLFTFPFCHTSCLFACESGEAKTIIDDFVAF